jgi:hypothetical protein
VKLCACEEGSLSVLADRPSGVSSALAISHHATYGPSLMNRFLFFFLLASIAYYYYSTGLAFINSSHQHLHQSHYSYYHLPSSITILSAQESDLCLPSAGEDLQSRRSKGPIGRPTISSSRMLHTCKHKPIGISHSTKVQPRELVTSMETTPREGGS